MLEEIEIRDLGVIAHARLTPGRGFTAITGETGAGKTMLLTALDLLLGGRADAALVRIGAERAQVDGRFADVPDRAVDRALEAGADLDEGALLLGRTVAAQGRSRAHLGGRSVPQGVLSDLADQLVTVHGQSEQVQLRSTARQRELVDAYAGPEHAAALARAREAHARVRALEGALAEARAGVRTRALEITTLTTALAEIEEARILPGEDESLREEADRLDNVEELAEAALAARAALTGDGERPGAVALVEQAARALARVAGVDPTLAALATQLTDSAYAVGDLDAELGRHLGTLEADPGRLDAVHARRAQLAALARSYGMPFGERGEDDPPAGSSDAVLAWARAARTRLEELMGPGHDVDGLAAQLAEAVAHRDAVARTLTATRQHVGRELAEAVAEELRQLAMPGAAVAVEVTPTTPGPTGADAVAILLTPHPGAPARPLGQGASGGELSRVMLALEVALAQRRGAGEGSAATFVFDEVDAGIGGRTASRVGARLASLARHGQVLVVTHLAQVAAFADTQVVVEKDPAAPDGAVTTVREVDGEERTAELARMLSGETTDSALQHAEELLARSTVRPWSMP